MYSLAASESWVTGSSDGKGALGSLDPTLLLATSLGSGNGLVTKLLTVLGGTGEATFAFTVEVLLPLGMPALEGYVGGGTAGR